jgi:hypothetical protein
VDNVNRGEGVPLAGKPPVCGVASPLLCKIRE